MFVAIQNEIINVNHIIKCSTSMNVTTITMINNRIISLPTAEFEADVLTLLPMLKPQPDLVILPPEEVEIPEPPAVEPAAEAPNPARAGRLHELGDGCHWDCPV